ncbi:hypothetical protein O9929_05300 [Vibrio lentus]|nr:hypothetical protein [Vibrio lentus]
MDVTLLFRPYFQQTILGHENQYFTLGSTSGKRSYYYSYPVSCHEIIGVIVVKMDLSLIEASWRSKQSFLLLTIKTKLFSCRVILNGCSKACNLWAKSSDLVLEKASNI